MSDDPDDSARAGSAPGPDSDDGRDVAEELVSRLQLIEEQPLGDRAAAFALLHDELPDADAREVAEVAIDRVVRGYEHL
ncbi:hypothetical protein [Clavibacter michiganensis]|uniref:hypothetical protein n=1 Tax=Clavibacter michiganensis TaxID=28447 RepID=UPI0029302A1B|nr:hypothetical protein [Clavibacter michiganensis]